MRFGPIPMARSFSISAAMALSGYLVGVFLRGKSLFFIVANNLGARFARHFDQSGARIMRSARTDADEIKRFPALEA